ncbi:hypothetical protein ACIGXM_14350 [Kitasatospora sp. NPDC052896]|uniref:hypothetical protein n=1 Tax=Kitasatospora sp. NPDC052896 TaxID=3364061 RepID=UPI0037C606C7
MVAQARTRTSPKDMTGRRKAQLMEQHKEELLAKQQEVSLRNAIAAANLDVPVDLTAGGEAVPPAAEGDDDVAAPVQIAPDFATVRLVCDLEHVTIGQGNVYEELKEGQAYRLPLAHALHLHNLGYVGQWL